MSAKKWAVLCLFIFKRIILVKLWGKWVASVVTIISCLIDFQVQSCTRGFIAPAARVGGDIPRKVRGVELSLLCCSSTVFPGRGVRPKGSGAESMRQHMWVWTAWMSPHGFHMFLTFTSVQNHVPFISALWSARESGSRRFLGHSHTLKEKIWSSIAFGGILQRFCSSR